MQLNSSALRSCPKCGRWAWQLVEGREERRVLLRIVRWGGSEPGGWLLMLRIWEKDRNDGNGVLGGRAELRQWRKPRRRGA